VSWLFVAAVGILWVAFMLPAQRRRHSPGSTVEGFVRDMEVLAETESPRGRWIIAPKKATPFLGSHKRRVERARERRRQVFVFLLESIAITFLIGAVPPLRPVWTITALLAGLLIAYVFLLLSLKNVEHPRDRSVHEAVDEMTPSPETARYAGARGYASGRRYVAEGQSRSARPTYNGLGQLDEGDRVHVIVRSARELNVARA
jgi:hypothetical protein